MRRFTFLLGPIVYAELLKVARNKRWYVLRVILGLLLLYLVYQSYAYPIFVRGYPRNGVYSHMEMRLMASRLYFQLVVCQGVAIFCLAPTLTAGAIAEEKQRKTLHYLLTSRMSSFDIVIGKLFSRFFVLVLPVAICLPVIVMLGLLGGIEPWMVLCAYAAILTIALFEASLAILMSTLARRGRDALFLTLIVGVAWLVGPSLFEVFMLTRTDPWPERYREWVEPINRHLIMTSPLFLANPTTARGPIAGIWGFVWAVLTMVIHQWICIVILLSLAIWQLRPAFRRQDGAPAARSRLGRSMHAKFRSWRSRKAVGDDAMLWKETVGMPGSFALKAVTFITLIVITMSAYETLKDLIPVAYNELKREGYTAFTRFGRYQLNIALRAINTALFCVASLVLAAMTATSISREREDDTWISLVSTPLDGREILRAKLIGSLWAIRGLLVAIAFVWAFGLLIGSFHPVGVLISIVQLTIFIAFILGLGTLISLRAKTTMRAMGLTIGILICLALLLPILISSLEQGRGRVAGITSQPYMVACGQITYDEYDELLTGQGRHQRFATFYSLHQIVVVNILGTIFYAIAAWQLLLMGFRGFDKLLDRPRRAGVFGRVVVDVSGSDHRVELSAPRQESKSC